jgi:hypothetical protein
MIPILFAVLERFLEKSKTPDAGPPVVLLLLMLLAGLPADVSLGSSITLLLMLAALRHPAQ